MNRRGLTKGPKKILILLLLLLLAGAILSYQYRLDRLPYYYAMRTSVLAMLGRSPWCPLIQAVKGIVNHRRQQEIEGRLLGVLRLVEKDPTGFELWETPIGPLWIPQRDHALPAILAERERKIYGAGELGVRTGDIVLDCGAHLGTYTREALAAGAKLVVAIEPGPEQIICLRSNLARDIAAGRVIVYEKGVWDREDSLTLHHNPDDPASDTFFGDPSRPGEKVPLTTIDHLVADLKLERVNFIKMDIEGAEQKALAGAQATLARYRPRMAIAVYHRLEDAEKISALVRRAWSGYRMECGPCREVNGVIRPEILYFR